MCRIYFSLDVGAPCNAVATASNTLVYKTCFSNLVKKTKH